MNHEVNIGGVCTAGHVECTAFLVLMRLPLPCLAQCRPDYSLCNQGMAHKGAIVRGGNRGAGESKLPWRGF